jgi:hypothetical protein
VDITPSPSTIIRILVRTQELSEDRLYWLEYDLKYFFPGVRLTAVFPDHCDWEGRFQGELWTQARVDFLVRHRGRIQAIDNPPDPLLDTDIYNVGLLESPCLPLYKRFEAFEFPRYQVGDVISGPCHLLGWWWQIVALDPLHFAASCLPAPAPVSSFDHVPRFLYQFRPAWKSGKVEYWCPTCWKESDPMEGVSRIPLAELDSSQYCAICSRDFCAEDARAPSWATYSYRYLWRSPKAE